MDGKTHSMNLFSINSMIVFTYFMGQDWSGKASLSPVA